MRLRVRIVTPDCVFQDDQAEELILPTNTGQIGVLRGHAPLITVIDIGPLQMRQKSNWTPIALIGGFALVQDDQVTILVNEAVDASSVDRKEAELALEDATKFLNEAVSKKEKVERTFAFKRARARCQIAQGKNL